MPASSDQPNDPPGFPVSRDREMVTGGEGYSPSSPDGPVVATVTLPVGVALHARPAADLVRAASKLQVRITVAANGKQANARSILEVLALGAAGGTELSLSATGLGADAAVRTLASVAANLGS